MTMVTKSWIVSAALVAGLAVAPAALAQTTTPVPSQTVAPAAVTPAPAAPAQTPAPTEAAKEFKSWGGDYNCSPMREAKTS